MRDHSIGGEQLFVAESSSFYAVISCAFFLDLACLAEFKGYRASHEAMAANAVSAATEIIATHVPTAKHPFTPFYTDSAKIDLTYKHLLI